MEHEMLFIDGNTGERELIGDTVINLNTQRHIMDPKVGTVVCEFTIPNWSNQEEEVCPQCGFITLTTPQEEVLCLNIPECTWSNIKGGEDYTTAL